MKTHSSNQRKSSQRGFSLIELLIVVVLLGIIAALAVPYLVAAQQASRAASAVSSLRLIHSSQATYHNHTGVYGTLENLGDAGHILDGNLAGGSKTLYTFVVTPGADPSLQYTATADPTFKPEVYHHFFLDQTGIIRDEVGAPATAASAPLE
jgi:prepilin-type N-terminal cleavage/methylation domain-containing protein